MIVNTLSFFHKKNIVGFIRIFYDIHIKSI